MIKEIGQFNQEVIGIDINENEIDRLKNSNRNWLITALDEEFCEFENSQSIVDDVDALLDLCYFAIGGLYRMGLTESQIRRCFMSIHNANMNKKAGVKEGREGFDGVTDANKPEDWIAPEKHIEEILFHG
jgi:predicted HAD superfamily Cof-like phosphohydrolase